MKVMVEKGERILMEIMSMKISVIIPTYKPQAYLWECLDSLVAQTFPKEDFEVILVLNGCTEPYNGQIKDWLSQHGDLQVQYIQTDEGGVSNARNIALDKASGEYVTFIDDDDYVSPSFLAELYNQANPDTISLCYPYAFNDGRDEKQLPYGLTDVYNSCSKEQNIKVLSKVRKYFNGPFMKLIPMSFIQGRRYDVRFKNGEDSLFMFLISDKIHDLSFTSKDAVYYRRVRADSAATTARTLKEVFLNAMHLSIEYTKIYFSRIRHYNALFYITRLLGCLKSVLNYRRVTF